MDRFSAIHQDGQRSFSPLSILTPQPSLDSSPLSQDSTPIIQNILPRYYNDTPPKNAPQGGWTPFPTDLLFTPRNLQIFEGKIEPNKSVTGNLELKGEAMRCDHSAETNLRRDRENGNNNMGSEDWNIKDFKKNQKEQQMSRGTRRQFLRTKMCPFLSKGKCSNELFCSYAHSPEQLRPLPDLRRTKLCDETKKGRICANPHCAYAHAIYDLKPTPDLLTYKTTLCFFWKKGKCFNGLKCRFAHGMHELRPSSISNDQCPTTTEHSHPLSNLDATTIGSLGPTVTSDLLKSIAFELSNPKSMLPQDMERSIRPLLDCNINCWNDDPSPLHDLLQLICENHPSDTVLSIACPSHLSNRLCSSCAESLSISPALSFSPLQATSSTTPEMTPNGSSISSDITDFSNLESVCSMRLVDLPSFTHLPLNQNVQSSMSNISAVLENLMRIDRQ